MSKFLARLRLAKRKAADDLQAEADAAQERALTIRPPRTITTEANTAPASVVYEPEPVAFRPAPVCAACGELAAMFLVDVAVTWREADGSIRRVMRSFCCRECWRGWRAG